MLDITAEMEETQRERNIGHFGQAITEGTLFFCKSLLIDINYMATIGSDETILFGEYDTVSLNKVINQQRKVCKHQKRKTTKHYIEY